SMKGRGAVPASALPPNAAATGSTASKPRRVGSENNRHLAQLHQPASIKLSQPSDNKGKNTCNRARLAVEFIPMRGSLRPLLSFFLFACGALACAAGATAASASASSTVKAVRIWGGPDSTRVIFELSGPVDYRLFQLSNPDRVVLDLDNGVFGNGAVKDMRIGRFQGKARIVLDLDKAAHPKSFLLNPTAQYGYRLVVELGT